MISRREDLMKPLLKHIANFYKYEGTYVDEHIEIKN